MGFATSDGGCHRKIPIVGRGGGNFDTISDSNRRSTQRKHFENSTPSKTQHRKCCLLSTYLTHWAVIMISLAVLLQLVASKNHDDDDWYRLGITRSPTGSTFLPTPRPSELPTYRPTRLPTDSPTFRPSYEPTISPSFCPSFAPTTSPTKYPTEIPTYRPTKIPTNFPTKRPSYDPSCRPSAHPTEYPTVRPSRIPSELPTKSTRPPTELPTLLPTLSPTLLPTQSTFLPTSNPNGQNPVVSPSMTPHVFNSSFAPNGAGIGSSDHSTSNSLLYQSASDLNNIANILYPVVLFSPGLLSCLYVWYVRNCTTKMGLMESLSTTNIVVGTLSAWMQLCNFIMLMKIVHVIDESISSVVSGGAIILLPLSGFLLTVALAIFIAINIYKAPLDVSSSSTNLPSYSSIGYSQYGLQSYLISANSTTYIPCLNAIAFLLLTMDANCIIYFSWYRSEFTSKSDGYPCNWVANTCLSISLWQGFANFISSIIVFNILAINNIQTTVAAATLSISLIVFLHSAIRFTFRCPMERAQGSENGALSTSTHSIQSKLINNPVDKNIDSSTVLISLNQHAHSSGHRNSQNSASKYLVFSLKPFPLHRYTNHSISEKSSEHSRCTSTFNDEESLYEASVVGTRLQSALVTNAENQSSIHHRADPRDSWVELPAMDVSKNMNGCTCVVS